MAATTTFSCDNSSCSVEVKKNQYEGVEWFDIFIPDEENPRDGKDYTFHSLACLKDFVYQL